MPNLFPFMQPGLLDEDAQKGVQLQGLLGVASGLLDAAGPSPVRRSLGQGISAGLTTGLAAMNNATNQAFRAKQFGMQRDAFDLNRQKAESDIARQRKLDLNRARFANSQRMGGTDFAGNPVDQSGLFTAAFPEQSAAVYADSLKHKSPISVGGVLVDPNNDYNPIIDTRQPAKPSTFQQKMDAARVAHPDASPAELFAYATKPGISFTSPPDPTKEQEEISKGLGAEFNAIRQRGVAAYDTLRAVDQFDAGDFPSGPFAGTRLALGRLAQFVGVDSDTLGLGDIADGESQQATSNKLAKAQRVSGEGVMSDSDFKVLLASVMNINNTAEGNAKISFAMRRAAERDIAKARAATAWYRKEETMLGFEEDWADTGGSKPLFTKKELQAIGRDSVEARSMTGAVEDLTPATGVEDLLNKYAPQGTDG